MIALIIQSRNIYDVARYRNPEVDQPKAIIGPIDRVLTWLTKQRNLRNVTIATGTVRENLI